MDEMRVLETKSAVIPASEWKWFGNAAHFICGYQCRFHMATVVGDYLISTVGEMWPEEGVREIYANYRGITLEGRGDARAADYMEKIGYEDIGYGRKYETMVFRAGEPCKADGCGCGLPSIASEELDFGGYNDAGSATIGHMEMCTKFAAFDEAIKRANT